MEPNQFPILLGFICLWVFISFMIMISIKSAIQPSGTRMEKLSELIVSSITGPVLVTFIAVIFIISAYIGNPLLIVFSSILSLFVFLTIGAWIMNIFRDFRLILTKPRIDKQNFIWKKKLGSGLFSYHHLEEIYLQKDSNWLLLETVLESCGIMITSINCVTRDRLVWRTRILSNEEGWRFLLSIISDVKIPKNIRKNFYFEEAYRGLSV